MAQLVNLDLGIITSIIIAVGSLITALTTRKKARSDAVGSISQAAKTLSEAYEERLTKMTATIKDLEEKIDANDTCVGELEENIKKLEWENREMKHGITTLITQLRRMDCIPDWDLSKMKPFVKDD